MHALTYTSQRPPWLSCGARYDRRADVEAGGQGSDDGVWVRVGSEDLRNRWGQDALGRTC